MRTSAMKISNIRHRASRRFHREGGFTLVELTIAAALMLVVLAGIYTIWFGLQRTYSFTEDDMRAQAEARTALNEMVEYIRTARQPDLTPAGYQPGDGGKWYQDESLDLAIVSADANTLVCWTDTDRDPDHDLELVRFRVDTASRTLYRDESQTGDLTFSSGRSVKLVGNWVANSAETPLFSYAGANGRELPAPVSDPTQIREVTIDLRIDLFTDRAPVTHQLRSVVQPRNMRQY